MFKMSKLNDVEFGDLLDQLRVPRHNSRGKEIFLAASIRAKLGKRDVDERFRKFVALVNKPQVGGDANPYYAKDWLQTIDRDDPERKTRPHLELYIGKNVLKNAELCNVGVSMKTGHRYHRNFIDQGSELMYLKATAVDDFEYTDTYNSICMLSAYRYLKHVLATRKETVHD